MTPWAAGEGLSVLGIRERTGAAKPDMEKAMPDPGGNTVTRGRLLAKNTVLSLLGQFVPVLAAFLAIPAIIRALGAPRFGVLSLAWMVVGYFGLFNMGVGRATIKYVAENLASGKTQLLPKLIWTSLSMLGLFGAFAGTLLVLCSALLVNRFLNVPSYLRPETIKAFRLLALAIPFDLAIGGLRGILAAQQRFGTINAIKAPAGAASVIIPLLALSFTRSIYSIIAALVAAKVIVFFIYFYFCLKWTPGMRKFSLPDAALFKKLLGFGGWLTVSNIIGPLMDYMDRFIIGAMLTMSAVAYYCTPFDMLYKLLIIPGSLLAVVFPAFSATYATDRDRFVRLYERAIKYIIMAVAPILIVLVVMAKPLLAFWLGGEFASRSAAVLQVLAIGIFINATAQAPCTALQGMGRPDLTAKLHVIELPLYLAAMRLLIPVMGIAGAALAWTLRNAVDACLLYWLADKSMPRPAGTKKSMFAQPVLVAVMSLSIFVQGRMHGFNGRFLYLLCASTAVCAFLWLFLFDMDEKRMIVDFMRASARGLVA